MNQGGAQCKMCSVPSTEKQNQKYPGPIPDQLYLWDPGISCLKKISCNIIITFRKINQISC